MKSLRLCFIGPANNVTTRRWVEWFTRRGHETTLITVEPVETDVACNFHQVNVDVSCGPRKIRRLTAASWAAITLKQLRPDVVHAHYLRGLAWGLALSGVHPRVVTPWGSDVLAEQGAFPDWYSKPLTSAVLRSADLVTVHSRYMESRIQPFLKRNQRVERIGWGVDVRRFKPGLDVSGLRRQWDIRETDRVIFSPRLAQRFYRHEVVVRALQQILQAYPTALLVIPEQFADAPYVEELKQLATEIRVRNRIRFVGSIDYQDMPAWQCLAEAAVMMPESDGMPNTLLETFACGGVPVLAKLPQYEELVSHGDNGFLIEPCPSTIAQTVMALFSDGEIRKAMGMRNRAFAVEQLDQDLEMARMERWYQQLADRGVAGQSAYA